MPNLCASSLVSSQTVTCNVSPEFDLYILYMYIIDILTTC